MGKSHLITESWASRISDKATVTLGVLVTPIVGRSNILYFYSILRSINSIVQISHEACQLEMRTPCPLFSGILSNQSAAETVRVVVVLIF